MFSYKCAPVPYHGDPALVASTRTARAAVVRLVLYSAASSAVEGICSPGSHSPRVQPCSQRVRYGQVRDSRRSAHTPSIPRQ